MGADSESDIPWAQPCDPGTDVSQVETPAYVIDLSKLRENLQVLDRVQCEAGCKILLALKGFAAWSTFSEIRKVLPGITASSPDEARLGKEEFGGEVHAYAPAYSEADFQELLPLVDHLVVNSPTQLRQFATRARARGIEVGLRVNPEHSEVKTALYDPCAPGSRLGTRRSALTPDLVELLDGLHFHTLCELGSDALERTLAAFEARFGEFIPKLKWVNFGGGHHITRPDYDVDLLIRLVKGFKERWKVNVYLEPGEAIGLNTGTLVASVLDIIPGEPPIAILDTSATAHMPDVLEMPYRAEIRGGARPGVLGHDFRLGGLTCLAGDVIGDYSFAEPLEVGSRLVFLDMAHYTMVKNTTFNGVRLPSIVIADGDARRVVRRFGYADYKHRLS
ncbi:MAG: carboxynorspermidine decarboxylase [Polyangiaceae bacterium]